MARNRPEYRAPAIDYPKQAGAGFEAMLMKRTPFNDFSEGSGRRQCKAIKRGTNRQCGCNAIHGSNYCWHHRGGLNLERIVKQFRPDATVLVKDGTLRKRYWIALALNQDVIAEVPLHVRESCKNMSLWARGRKFEEWLNKKKT